MNTDAVVVLGAAVVAPGTPGEALRRRLAHGVRVFGNRGIAFLVLSGGHVGAPPSEAELMRVLALEQGVADDRIVVENQSRNTFENALYTGRIMRERGWRRVLVVTDAFHMPRALFIFRRLGLDAIGAPVPRDSGCSRWQWYRAYTGELFHWAQSAYLFAIGRHKPIVEAVWGR
jgi:uncharacterized SAM-binding protein YcdF (DUF218 family)